jgi:chromosome segregation ATPase
VRSKNGRVLYPTAFVEPDGEAITTDQARIAAENFELMTEGLEIEVDTKLAHNSLLSNSLLVLFILLSVSILSLHYRTAVKRAQQDEHEKRREIDRLRQAEQESEKRLSKLMHTREELDSEFKRLSSELESEKSKADKNESDWIEEIESLENRLNENLALQQAQQEEIAKLREDMQSVEKSRRKMDKQKTRSADAAGKRFATLYKNLTVHERAVSGYVDLSEDMKIKAEEVIHQLNEDADKVTIKRKVFGKKGHATVLEVLFAYKGRLYFRKSKEKRVEILAIGTKNTQARELEFLSKL